MKIVDPKKVLSAIIAALALAVLPSVSTASTVSDLQAQIQALQAQLQTLEAQLSSQQGSSFCYDFNSNLSVGSSGSDVSALQTALQKEGFQTGQSGQFDEKTASAVSGFQEKYASEILTPLGLQYGTGYLGSATRAELNKLYGCGTGAGQSSSVGSGSVSTNSGVGQQTNTSTAPEVGDPYIGNQSAPLTMYYWSDYQCPFCQRFETQVLPTLKSEYVDSGKLKIVFRDLQFLGRDSTTAAVWGRAVWQDYPDEYFTWRQAIYENQGTENSGWVSAEASQAASSLGMDVSKLNSLIDQNGAAYKSAIAGDYNDGTQSGIDNTPSFTLGDKTIIGDQPLSVFTGDINGLLGGNQQTSTGAPLSASLNSSFSSPNLIKGETQTKVASFELTAAQDQDVSVNSISMESRAGFTNLKAYFSGGAYSESGAQYGSTQNGISGAEMSPDYAFSFTLYPSAQFPVQSSNGPVFVSVYADISPNATQGAYSPIKLDSINYTALNNSGGGSVTSALVNLIGQSAEISGSSAPISQVTGLTANPADGSVSLSWQAATAENGVGVYNIYRSASSGFTPGSSNLIAQANALSFTDSNLSSGTYYYAVAAQDVDGNVGPASAEAQAVIAAPQTGSLSVSSDSSIVPSACASVSNCLIGAFALTASGGPVTVSQIDVSDSMANLNSLAPSTFPISIFNETAGETTVSYNSMLVNNTVGLGVDQNGSLLSIKSGQSAVLYIYGNFSSFSSSSTAQTSEPITVSASLPELYIEGSNNMPQYFNPGSAVNVSGGNISVVAPSQTQTSGNLIISSDYGLIPSTCGNLSSCLVGDYTLTASGGPVSIWQLNFSNTNTRLTSSTPTSFPATIYNETSGQNIYRGQMPMNSSIGIGTNQNNSADINIASGQSITMYFYGDFSTFPSDSVQSSVQAVDYNLTLEGAYVNGMTNYENLSF